MTLLAAGDARGSLQKIIQSHPLAILCVIGGVVSFTGLFHELWTPDEPRDAAIGRAMWTSGDWITPRLNGEPFLEKPPLYWWVQAALFTLIGDATPALARLPSALFGFMTLWATYALGRRFFSPRDCLVGCLALSSMALFTLTTHWVVVDNALLFAVTGAWFFFVRAEAHIDGGSVHLLGMYLCLAAAFLAKGVVGLGIPVLGMAVYLLWSGRLRGFIGWHLLVGAGLVAAAAGIWLWHLWLEEGLTGLQTFLAYNQLGRFFPHEEYRSGHIRPFWYYFVHAPADLLPWTPFLLLAAVAAWRHWKDLSEKQRAGIRLCVSGTLPVLLVLSLAGTKRSLYLLPIFPLLGLFLGWWAAYKRESNVWEQRLERGWDAILLTAVALSPAVIFFDQSRWPHWLAAVLMLAAAWYLLRRPVPPRRPERLSATVILVCLALANLWITAEPYMDRHKSFVPFIEELKRNAPADEPLYAFRPDETTYGVVNFYAGRKLTVIDLEEVLRLARGAAPGRLIVRDTGRSGGNYDAIVRAGVPHRVVSHTIIGRDRRLRILTFEGSQHS